MSAVIGNGPSSARTMEQPLLRESQILIPNLNRSNIAFINCFVVELAYEITAVICEIVN